MADVRFYHLIQKTVEEVLPDLLEKTVQQSSRAVVMTGSSERAETFSRHLWVYKQDSFLPHGTSTDGNAQLQPIFITPDDERPNDADVLFLTDGATSNNLSSYKRVCVMFDGNDENSVVAARAYWKSISGQGHEMSYWQQGPKGWTNKAV